MTGRLDLDVILRRISESKSEFPSIKIVVFSGGEATLLKSDLIEAIAYSTELGLLTRVVSNGSWGKSPSTATRTASGFLNAGLKELNLSTGKDHQEWVPAESVINAAIATAEQGIFVLITVEADDFENARFRRIADDPRIASHVKSRRISVQSNSWMPFTAEADKRHQSQDLDSLRSGCGQIFGNIVITPHDNISACCGLTLEHIPEMRLGKCNGTNIGTLYKAQADDFLKYWIRMDGPYSILETILGEESKAILQDVVHTCQACVILHKNPNVRNRLLLDYEKYVPDVMSRFHLSNAVANAGAGTGAGNQ